MNASTCVTKILILELLQLYISSLTPKSKIHITLNSNSKNSWTMFHKKNSIIANSIAKSWNDSRFYCLDFLAIKACPRPIEECVKKIHKASPHKLKDYGD